jgi:hypothetical protein
MLVDDREALVTDLRELVGDDLRVVAEYGAEGYDAFYLREDITPRLDAVADEIHDDLVLQGIGRGRLEDLFDAGALHCSMHRFDDLMAFHFTAGELTGLFVTVDSNTDVPLASFSAACKSRLPD